MSGNSSTMEIDKETYYHGLLPRADARQLLKENGDFLLRMSEPKTGDARSYVVSVLVDKNAEEKASMKNLIIHAANNMYWIESTQFESIPKLVEFYISPAGQTGESQIRLLNPIHRQVWELEHEWITIQNKLGEGAFGEVSMGLFKFKKQGNGVQVAVKQAKLEKMGKAQIKEFMGEARHLRSLDHPNIVKLYGVAVIQEPLYMVMELASDGALDSYLKKNPTLPVDIRNEMILQAALGLEYMHAKPLIHRDIAARNCLYGDKKVKISDFGLTRSGSLYQQSQTKKVPLRWLAVETLIKTVYTPKTDVWAYGVMCWEIYMSAKEPYPDMTAAEVNQKVREGFRMTVPAEIHQDIQKMIKSCWMENPTDRPTMAAIVVILQKATREKKSVSAASGGSKAKKPSINAREYRSPLRKKRGKSPTTAPEKVPR